VRVLQITRVLVLALALATLVTGCATDKALKKREADAMRDRGERFLQVNQPTMALKEFLAALELNPNDPYLHYDLAYAYDQKGILDKAEFHLKKAIRLKPDYSDAYNYLGVLYFRKGEVDLAIEQYNKALENIVYLSPQNAHFNLGVAYLSRKQYNLAIKHLEETVSLVPNYAAAYVNLGRAYEGQYKYREARRAYEKAVEFAPNAPEAQLHLGKLLILMGDKRAAIKPLSEVVRLEPDSDMAREAQSYLNLLK
jgi:tetratricopeptide (TPR) repeat protein